MSELSIKISIAGRVYPLTIKRSEEQSVRKAAKDIEESIKNLQESYAVKDKQDLLAMTALQMSTELSMKGGVVVDESLNNRLLDLSKYLDKEVL